MNDVPERIWIQSDTKNHLSELRELEVQPVSDVLSAFTEYLSRTHHNALVAEAYEAAAEKCDARVEQCEREKPCPCYLRNCAIKNVIKRLTPSDALAARDADRKRVRDEALREAAVCADEYTHVMHPREVAKSILALIEGDQTDE